MIRPLAGHRVASLIPFLILAVATVVGGWVNSVDMRARVVDDYTDAGIKASLTHGSRSAVTDESGNVTFPFLPRTSMVRVDSTGYLRKSVSPTEEQIRMSPLSLTIETVEAGNKDKRITKVEVRQGDKLLNTPSESVTVILTPHPGRDAKLLVCAAGYNKKEIEARGVLMTVELTPGTDACPPLPSPWPTPTRSPSPSPTPTPTPSPSPS